MQPPSSETSRKTKRKIPEGDNFSSYKIRVFEDLHLPAQRIPQYSSFLNLGSGRKSAIASE
ncbi:hypothetical protein [Coleofasciculus sp. FACHB-712]|uniref:hypothetical protein n=1 Tax=Coleofasciculus sp. FACHB-712 TaxID=2692789 RepID=UPI001689864C|nr:hypothetical protein [Coleofasciculus sp. FACHB-712]